MFRWTEDKYCELVCDFCGLIYRSKIAKACIASYLRYEAKTQEGWKRGRLSKDIHRSFDACRVCNTDKKLVSFFYSKRGRGQI